MARTRLSTEAEARIIEEYQAWAENPIESTDELAERLGVGRQTLYAVLRRNGIPTRSASSSPQLARRTNGIDDRMAEMALKHLVDDLVGCRRWVEDAAGLLTLCLSKPGPDLDEVRALLARRP